jgi:hypothetical protein
VSDFDHVTFYPRVDLGAIGGGTVPMTSLKSAMVKSVPLTFKRGRPSNDPRSMMASVGSCEFSLLNIDQRFSPNNAATRLAGFTRGKLIQIVAEYGSGPTITPVWTGRIWTIDPRPFAYGERLTRIVARCTMDDLSAETAGIAPQVDKTENELITAIYTLLSAYYRPPGVSFDTSLDAYPYSFWQSSQGSTAYSMIQQVADSAQAFVYPLADGTLKVENRQSRFLLTSAFAFSAKELKDVIVPTDQGNVYDHIKVTNHPATVSSAPVVLCSVTSKLQVLPGTPVEIFLDYRSPDETLKLVGGINQITTLVAGTDYKGYSKDTGSTDGGTDQTADLSIAVVAFAASAKFTITNNGAGEIYLVDASGNPLLQLRGTMISDDGPQVWDAGSGARVLEIDLPFQDSAAIAQDIAALRLLQYADPTNQVDQVEFIPARSARLMEQAILAEIGSAITVTEPQLGLSAVEAVIDSIEMRVEDGLLLSCRYTTSRIPWTGDRPVILDDATYGVLDTAKLGYA